MSLFNCFKKKKTRLFYPEIELNSPPANEGKDFPANRISSTKYTIITFLPKNLWEQFRYVSELSHSPGQLGIEAPLGAFVERPLLVFRFSSLLAIFSTATSLFSPPLDATTARRGLSDRIKPRCALNRSTCPPALSLCSSGPHSHLRSGITSTNLPHSTYTNVPSAPFLRLPLVVTLKLGGTRGTITANSCAFRIHELQSFRHLDCLEFHYTRPNLAIQIPSPIKTDFKWPFDIWLIIARRNLLFVDTSIGFVWRKWLLRLFSPLTLTCFLQTHHELLLLNHRYRIIDPFDLSSISWNHMGSTHLRIGRLCHQGRYRGHHPLA